MIALVGGVAAGKSTAAREFAALGCEPIDADAIGYELLADPDVRQRLRRYWGGRIFRPDGSVDRKALGEIVFADPTEMEKLNRVMQPRIRRSIEAKIAEAQKKTDVAAIVLDAAILFEAGWDDLCTHVLFVNAPEAVRIQRAAERGWNEQAWRAREKSQISLDRKAAECYGQLDNSSSVSYLREQVRRVFHRIVPKADGL